MTSKEWFDWFVNSWCSDNHIAVTHIMWNDTQAVYFQLRKGITCLKNWRFGVWFTTPSSTNPNVTEMCLFTRHKDDMVKFNPERSFSRLVGLASTKNTVRTIMTNVHTTITSYTTCYNTSYTTLL